MLKNTKYLFALVGFCLVVAFSSIVFANLASEKVLPVELNERVFMDNCLQCHVFAGEYFGDNPKRRKGSIYGEKVGEDDKLRFIVKRVSIDLKNSQQAVSGMVIDNFIKRVRSMMSPLNEKESIAVDEAAKIYYSYAVIK